MQRVRLRANFPCPSAPPSSTSWLKNVGSLLPLFETLYGMQTVLNRRVTQSLRKVTQRKIFHFSFSSARLCEFLCATLRFFLSGVQPHAGVGVTAGLKVRYKGTKECNFPFVRRCASFVDFVVKRLKFLPFEGPVKQPDRCQKKVQIDAVV
jgi:hypothetical protein